MILQLEMTTRDWSGNVITLYRASQQLQKYHDTIITLRIEGREGVMKTVKDILEAGGLYPETLDLDELCRDGAVNP